MTLQMDYARIAALEERLGTGIIAIAAQLAEGRLRFQDMVEMAAICAKPRLQREGLGEKLLAGGIMPLAEALAALLERAMQGRLHDNAMQAGHMRAELEEMMALLPD